MRGSFPGYLRKRPSTFSQLPEYGCRKIHLFPLRREAERRPPFEKPYAVFLLQTAYMAAQRLLADIQAAGALVKFISSTVIRKYSILFKFIHNPPVFNHNIYIVNKPNIYC